MHSYILTFIVAAFALFVVPSKAPPSTGDTCTYFANFDLTASLNTALDLSIPEDYGNINGCLCVSGISGSPMFFLGPVLLILYRSLRDR
jgi:hypothetical protein